MNKFTIAALAAAVVAGGLTFAQQDATTPGSSVELLSSTQGTNKTAKVKTSHSVRPNGPPSRPKKR